MSSNVDAPPSSVDPLDSEVLTATVCDVDGVTDIYPPAPTLTQAPQLVAAIITGSPERVNRVDVTSSGTQHTITARIGTRRDTPAPGTATRVADALLQLVPAGHRAAVNVQISRIA